MIRRDRQADGSVVVWSERVVTLHDATGAVVETRPLTAAEAADFAAWADRQPGGLERLDADAATAAVTAEYAAAHPGTTVAVDLSTVEELRAEVARLAALVGGPDA